ncbi:MAG: hypothetical protein EOP05_22465 [Proteobacteria bacterium]|nr:MAG: hypothetical protein EOP05_22465 [Pseudomonadota bacterium]
MKLLIVRHAIAVDRADHQGEEDHRPLTIEGLRKMRKNARGLSIISERPAALITSPLTRAVQTAEVLRDTWEGLDFLVSEALRPKAKPIELVKWIRANVEEDGELICIVGHEPHLTHLIGWFLTRDFEAALELKKGGACLLDFEGQISRGAGKLLWLATPSLLRAAR